jgi:ATP-dependent DNA helicase
VVVYRFATRGTVEEMLLGKAEVKRRLEMLVIQKGRFRSLLDAGEGEMARSKRSDGEGEEELRGILEGGEGFGELGAETNVSAASGEGDRGEVEGNGVGEILTEEDLRILTDRSEAAYERAEKGIELEGHGGVFRLAETRREGEKVLSEMSTGSGKG